MGKKSRRTRSKVSADITRREAVVASAETAPQADDPAEIAEVTANVLVSDDKRNLKKAEILTAALKRYGISLPNMSGFLLAAECSRLVESLSDSLQTLEEARAVFLPMTLLMVEVPPSIPSPIPPALRGLVEEIPEPFSILQRDTEVSECMTLFQLALDNRLSTPAAFALQYVLSFPPQRHAEGRLVLLGAWFDSLAHLISDRFSEEDLAPAMAPFVNESAQNLLRCIADDEAEPMVCRMLAMSIRAIIVGKVWNPTIQHVPTTREASYLRRAIAYFRKVDKIFIPGIEEDKDTDKQNEQAVVRRVEKLKVHLSNIGRPLIHQTVFPRIKTNRGTWAIEGGMFSDVDPPIVAINAAKGVGGCYCDVCTERVDQTLSCSRCRLTHYCSTECQQMAWYDGHSAHCTPFGHFVKGDAAILQNLEGVDGRLNGTIVQIIGKVDRQLYSALVPDDDHLRKVAVRRKNLRHIRPAR